MLLYGGLFVSKFIYPISPLTQIVQPFNVINHLLYPYLPSPLFSFHVLDKHIINFACDDIQAITEKTESVYVHKLQCSINGTLYSIKFIKSRANK